MASTSRTTLAPLAPPTLRGLVALLVRPIAVPAWDTNVAGER